MAYVQRTDEPEDSGIAAEWLRNGGARVYVAVRGARYHRDIEKNGLVTLREAGALVRVDPATVWRWVQSGKLEAFDYRGVTVVGISALRKLGLDTGYLIRGKGGAIVPAR